MNRPNLFQIATSELSQDAFFSWLMQWADPSNMQENPGLCSAGQNFLRFLIGKQYNAVPEEINKVESGRQWNNIDVYANVDDEFLVVIEDKTGTSRHSNQLERHRKLAEKYDSSKKFSNVFVYLKSENESRTSLHKVEMSGYAVVTREDLLSFFNIHPVDNDIYNDYVAHVRDLHSSINSFRNLPVNRWNWYSWQGFYAFLDKELNVENWCYVANPSGGFLGLWWHYTEWKGHNVYLQIEQQIEHGRLGLCRLCFKINKVTENHIKVRNDCAKMILAHAAEAGHTEIRPARSRKGNNMTTAVIDRADWLAPDDSIVDLEQAVTRLRQYEKFLDNVFDNQ